MTRWVSLGLRALTAIGFAGTFAITGCGGDDSGSTQAGAGACPPDRTIAGACAGVDSQPLCGGAVCTSGVACAKVIEVTNDAELAAATGSSAAGDCIALHPGSYGDAVLPGGVSLLGRAASAVRVHRVEVGAGSGSMLRGVTVDGGGIVLQDGARETRVDSVRVVASASDGIEVRTDASAHVRGSEISGSSRYGVSAIGAEGVTLEASLVQGSRGPGIWAECTAGCACVKPITLDLSQTIVRDSKRVGVSLIGARGSFTGVEIAENTVGDNFEASGGLVASKCSDVTARGLRIADNSAFGMLLDDSGGTIGAAGDDQGVQIERNLIGLWMQGIQKSAQSPVKVENAHLDGNSGVGVGFGGGSKGIIIYGCEVKSTALMTLPVLVHGVSAGSEDVGDGLSWLAGSAAQIDRVTLAGNGRESVLIDGEVAMGSSIANLTLSGGDEAKGVVQQSFPSGGVAPTVGAGAPALQQSQSELFSVPKAPEVPSGG